MLGRTDDDADAAASRKCSAKETIESVASRAGNNRGEPNNDNNLNHGMSKNWPASAR